MSRYLSTRTVFSPSWLCGFPVHKQGGAYALTFPLPLQRPHLLLPSLPVPSQIGQSRHSCFRSHGIRSMSFSLLDLFSVQSPKYQEEGNDCCEQHCGKNLPVRAIARSLPSLHPCRVCAGDLGVPRGFSSILTRAPSSLQLCAESL